MSDQTVEQALAEIVSSAQAVLEQIEVERATLARQERVVRQQIDEIVRLRRPTYPTPDQREAITAAADIIRKQQKPESRHGDSPLPGRSVGVLVDGKNRWMSVEHRAPYAKANRSAYLWSFTDEEIESILDAVRAEGLTVVEHWGHGKGISIRTAPPQEES